jgi:hypothetical protein
MLKTSLFVSGLIAVCVCGLISCSSEKKSVPARPAPTVAPTFDIYNPAPPRIVQAAGGVDIRSEQRHFDVQDQLDFRDRAVERVEITAECVRGEETLRQTRAIAQPGLVPFYQLIPAAELAHDLGVQEAVCSFELSLFNKLGSKHGFPVAVMNLTDKREWSVKIVGPAIAKPTPDNLNGIFVREEGSAGGKFRVLCQEGETSSLSAQPPIDIRQFDFSSLSQHPLQAWQTCRILEERDGLLVGASSPFPLLFPPTDKLVGSSQAQAPSMGEILHANGTQYWRAGHLIFSNPTGRQRRLRFPRKLPFQLTLISGNSLQRIAGMGIVNHGPGPDEVDEVLTLGPGGVYNFDIRSEPHIVSCKIQYGMALVQWPQNLQAEEIDDQDRVIDVISVPLAPWLYTPAGQLPGDFPNGYQAADFGCSIG